MNSQNEIIQKQNDDGMLKCQYAARKYYNQAEILNYISWVIAFISSITFFIPESLGVISLIIPFIINILTLILSYSIKCNVKLGAQMRNFFDEKVLGIGNSFSASDEHKIWEKANTLIEARNNTFAYQSTHNGKDKPPGLKDWYVFTKSKYTPKEAVFECQKQNYWWTEKLYRKRIQIYIIVAIISLFISVIGFLISPLKTFLCLFSFVLKLCTDIVEFTHCNQAMKSISTITNLKIESLNQSTLEELQQHIKERREIQILEMNYFHKKNAYKWSSLYETTSIDRISH